jgi:sigma-B regulation protein RsbU (phosphoserine phosphatase)
LGGIGSQHEGICSAGIVASLNSNAYGGSKGGDNYYLSVCESDRLTRAALVDVAGHGAQVAHVSKWLYNILESHMNDIPCDEVLAQLNHSAVERGIRALTTATVVGFYTLDFNLYFAYASHPPALLQRKGSVEWRPLALDAEPTHHLNAPLGVISDAAFGQQYLLLTSGHRVFLHTDGLTEAMNHAREPFGGSG